MPTVETSVLFLSKPCSGDDMQALDPPILFEKQHHQEECIERIMGALEENQDGRPLAVKAYFDFNSAFPRKPDNRLDILMETGTGKTYVYLKAIFEIHKRFGKTKFVIIVPRTSIKLGVMQNVRLTANHFFTRYGRHLRCVSYPEDGRDSVLGGFLRTNDLSVLLTTNSAFNHKDKLINKPHEGLDKRTTVWEEIVRMAPVVIMDEPHLLTGRRTTEYLNALRSKSLFMRFGATYPDNEDDGSSNIAYVLDSITAFNGKLVKRIRVSVVDLSAEDGGVRVIRTLGRNAFRIAYTINGQCHEANARLGNDLGAVTGLATYRNRSVTKVSAKAVVLEDGTRLPVGAYSLTDYEIREMVRETIGLHFERERKMFPMGVKTLSLFFVPGISDFRGDNPRVKKIFEKEYADARRKLLVGDINEGYREYLKRDYQDGKLRVHEGYFSGDTSKGNKDAQEAWGVNVILNDKKRLLSLEEPLRFIFSVWALQEGWDNPNVFNICKLSHTERETSRRQQVGRGLRIAVNQRGLRMIEDRLAERKVGFDDVNELNVVVPAYERTFIEDMQREIHDASPSIADFTITLDAMKDKGLDDAERSMVYSKLLENSIIDAAGNRKASVQEFLESHRALFPSIGSERFGEIVKVLQDARGAVSDRRKPERAVCIRQNKWQEFKDLWESINRGSCVVYRNVDEEEIIRAACKAFDGANIPEARTVIRRYAYDSEKDEIREDEEYTTGEPAYFKKTKFHENVMKIARDHRWPMGFLLKLFNRIDAAKFRSNPALAEKRLVEIVRDAVHRAVLEKVEYRFTETAVYGNGLQKENGESRGSLPYTKIGKRCADGLPREEFLYDTIVYDSDIELKSIRDPMKFTNYGERTRNVTVFAKLPRIDIPTPFKTYNPDFAYVVSCGNDQTLFLVVETKGYDSETDVPEDEQKKIDYGLKFFESLQQTLPENVKIKFQRRLNVDDMSDMLRRCYSG